MKLSNNDIKINAIHQCSIKSTVFMEDDTRFQHQNGTHRRHAMTHEALQEFQLLLSRTTSKDLQETQDKEAENYLAIHET